MNATNDTEQYQQGYEKGIRAAHLGEETQPIGYVSHRALCDMRDMRDGQNGAISLSLEPESNEDVPVYAAPMAVAPLTDEQILDIASNFKSQHEHGGNTYDDFDALGFGKAVLIRATQDTERESPIDHPAAAVPEVLSDEPIKTALTTLAKKLDAEVSRRNFAYDVFGWDNTRESVNPELALVLARFAALASATPAEDGEASNG